MQWLSPIASGVLLFLSYSPYGHGWLAWIALVPLLWSWQRVARGSTWGVTLPRLAVRAVVAGLVWGGGIFYPLLTVDEGSWLERIGGFTAASGGIALFLLVFLIVARQICLSGTPSLWRFVVVLPLVWIGLEFLMKSVMVGFSPYLGITQWHAPSMLALSSYTGVHGISALVIGANGLALRLLVAVESLFQTVRLSPDASSPIALFGAGARGVGRTAAPVVGFGVIMALIGQGWFMSLPPFSTWTSGTTDRVVSHQGASDQSTEFQLVAVQPGFTPSRYRQAADGDLASHFDLFAEVMRLTEEALDAGRTDQVLPTLVVWPETTLHIPALIFDEVRTPLLDLAHEHQVAMLVGLPRRTSESERERNSAHLVSETGTFTGVYDKVYVIPIAESRFEAGHVIEPMYPFAKPEGAGVALGIGICSDVVDPRHARTAVQAGAGSLHYLASLNHIGSLVYLERALLAFRAAEHRIYVTQIATTGPTLVINALGQTIEELNGTGPGVMYAGIPARTATTVYTTWGDWPVALAALVLCANGLAGRWSVRRRFFERHGVRLKQRIRWRR